MNNAVHKILFYILLQFHFFIIKSIILDNITKIVEKPFKYNHISININGDLVIDSSSLSYERNFFGITKNGRPLFTDNNSNKKNNYSNSLTYSYGRMEGESLFIRVNSSNPDIHGKELLMGISKAEDNYYRTELYYLPILSSYSYCYSYKTKELFNYITSNSFSILEDPLNNDSIFNYYVSYISKNSEEDYKFYTRKINYYLNDRSDENSRGFNKEEIINEDAVKQNIISCFFTKLNYYICFYVNNNRNLTIYVYEPMTKVEEKTEIYSYDDTFEEQSFYKGIFLKDEIGFFAYFKNNEKFPCFSLYERKLDNKMYIYNSFEEIQLTNLTYINTNTYNDLIKLNNNTTCYISSSADRKGLNIIVFNFI